MVTIETPLRGGVSHVYCLSTDDKPTNVANGSDLRVIDHGFESYIFNGETRQWIDVNGNWPVSLEQSGAGVNYTAGDEFDTSGMTLTMTLNSEETVTPEEYTVSPEVMTAEIDKVTISAIYNGIKASCEVEVNVSKLQLAVPTQSGTVTYDGTEQTASWADYDTSKMTISGDIAGTDAGNYTAAFSLVDKVNCEWADETTEDQEATWTIDKAEGEITLSAESATLSAESTTAVITASALGGGALSVASGSDATATAAIEDGTITITFVAAGNTTVTVSAAASDNYAAATAVITVTCEGETANE